MELSHNPAGRCEKRFVRQTILKHHIKSVHDKEDYPCPECPQSFKTRNFLYTHKTSVHSTDEKYSCQGGDSIAFIFFGPLFGPFFGPLFVLLNQD